jgi:hypothetical protein
MNRSRRILSTALVLLVLIAPLITLPAWAAEPARASESQTEILPLGDIRKGMQVIVRTVIQGYDPIDIPGEILGVMKNSLGPGQSMILAKLRGPQVESSGIAAGMSGSPVYVGDRLIGALAYSMGGFAKDPVAGITPIEMMLDLAEISEARRHGMPGNNLANPQQQARLGGDPSAQSPPARTASAALESIGLKPIATPLVVSGLAPGILEHFLPQIEALGAQAVAGVGGGGGTSTPAIDESPKRPLRAGDAVAAQLIRGDMSVGATGTVTYVEGDRVLAFGHPFLIAGSAEFPMARVDTLWTMSNLQRSHKISQMLETVGTWEQIRLPGISGVTSRQPEMIPMVVNVTTPGKKATYNYELAKHRNWTPVLAGISVAGSLASTPEFTDEATFSVTGRFGVQGHKDVVIENLYTGFGVGSSAALATAGDLQAIFGAVFQNTFEEPTVTSVEVTAEGIEEGRLSFVEGVWPSRTKVSPGETVQYRIRLRSFRGSVETRTLAFEVPESTPRGRLRVLVGGGSYLAASERRILARRLSGAGSLGQIIDIVNRLRRSDAIYGKAVRRLPGAVVQSKILPALPPSVLTTLRSNSGSREVATMSELSVWESVLPMDSIIVGGAVLNLDVR